MSDYEIQRLEAKVKPPPATIPGKAPEEQKIVLSPLIHCGDPGGV